MGWDTPTPGNSTAGCRISTSSVGHLGFTGTSIWIDREADVVVVLLSNRVALGPESKATMRGFRPVFHDGIFERLGKS
jgi:CubicO group peptidase (beta-lactamase class C family)